MRHAEMFGVAVLVYLAVIIPLVIVAGRAFAEIDDDPPVIGDDEAS